MRSESYFKASFHVSLSEEIDMLKQLHVCDVQHKIHPCGWGPFYCSKLCVLHYQLMERLKSIEVNINVPVTNDGGH